MRYDNQNLYLRGRIKIKTKNQREENRVHLPLVTGCDISLKTIGIGSNLRLDDGGRRAWRSSPEVVRQGRSPQRGCVCKNKGENRHIHGHLYAKHNTFNKHTNLYTHICTYALMLTSSFYCLHNHACTDPFPFYTIMHAHFSQPCTHAHTFKTWNHSTQKHVHTHSL